MKKLFGLIVIVIVGIGLYQIFRQPPDGKVAPSPLIVRLQAVNGSNLAGQAKIEENDGQARVLIELTGAPREVSQPAFLQRGTCSALGESIYTLSLVIDGASETTLTVALAAITDNLPLAVSIYKSATLNDNVACGEITTDD
ncbi:MAG: hypothetical protein AAB677_02275 [Patescibacteria group bacterium]